jgi:hypothetical protein
MTDEVRKRDGILNESSIFTQDNSDQKLSTADLAGTKENNPRLTSQARIQTDSREEVVAQSLKHPEDTVIEREPNKTETRVVAIGAAAAVAPSREQESTPLFPSSEANDLRGRWDAVQVGFVDEPRGAVEQADNLVASTMKRLAEIFAEERGRLESQWDQGENVSTEDLRLALRRYRSFFSRLLSV